MLIKTPDHFNITDVVLVLEFEKDYVLHRHFHTPNKLVAFLLSPHMHKVIQFQSEHSASQR
jgi:hypothetical protein